MVSRGKSKHYENAFKYALLQKLGIPFEETELTFRLGVFYESLSECERAQIAERCETVASIVKRFLPEGDKFIEVKARWRSKSNFDVVIYDVERFPLQIGLEIELLLYGLSKNMGFSMPVNSFFNICMEYIGNKEKQNEYSDEWRRIVSLVESHGGNWADFNYRDEVVIPVHALLFNVMSEVTDEGTDVSALLYQYRYGERPSVVVSFGNDETKVHYYDIFYPRFAELTLKRSQSGMGIIIKSGEKQTNVRVRLSSRNVDVNRIMVEVTFKSNIIVSENFSLSKVLTEGVETHD